MHMLTFRVTMEGPKDHKVKARGSKMQSFKREIESVCGKLLPPKGQRGTYTCLLPAKCIRRWSRLILPCFSFKTIRTNVYINWDPTLDQYMQPGGNWRIHWVTLHDHHWSMKLKLLMDTF